MTEQELIIKADELSKALHPELETMRRVSESALDLAIALKGTEGEENAKQLWAVLTDSYNKRAFELYMEARETIKRLEEENVSI